MRIILLGCPGAGKGTQSKVLAEKYGIVHIATGDLFRAEIAGKTPLGLKVADYLKSGTLVPDPVVVEMVAKHLDDSPSGFLLDGFPRTLEQAQALDQFMKKENQSIDLVLYLNMKTDDVIRRLTSRRYCQGCNTVYNLISSPPKVEGKCDKDSQDLRQRVDDGEAVVKKRLMVYEDLTRPLVAYYRSEQTLHEIEGSRPADQVTQDLVSIIDGLVVNK